MNLGEQLIIIYLYIDDSKINACYRLKNSTQKDCVQFLSKTFKARIAVAGGKLVINSILEFNLCLYSCSLKYPAGSRTATQNVKVIPTTGNL